MAYVLLDSHPTVQVSSPTLVGQALLCTIQSSPSGSVLVYTVPRVNFDADQGFTLLTDFSDAVEALLQGAAATGAYGSQGLDDSNLLYDAVTFIVTYVPTSPIPGTITGEVEIPAGVIILDPAIAQRLPGPTPLTRGSAAERIAAEYDLLKSLAGQ